MSNEEKILETLTQEGIVPPRLELPAGGRS